MDDESDASVEGQIPVQQPPQPQAQQQQALPPVQQQQAQVQLQQQVMLAPILFSPWHGEIDLRLKSGRSLWFEGITPLETKFPGYGKDLVRFLADVKNRVDKCQWHNELQFNGKNLLTQYGEIDLQEVIDARTVRLATAITTVASARPRMNALMMFHFIYDSLGSAPQKKVSTKLGTIDQDGPVLLKHVLDDTYVATQASTFSIKEKFYDLNLKKYKWNVHNLNQDVREKQVDLVAAGHASDETDVIISLFRAYNTSTNEEFKHSVAFWKNQWSSAQITTTEELMRKADEKYSEMRDLGTWGKKSARDDQIVALTSKIEELKKTRAPGGTGNQGSTPKSNSQKNGDKKNTVPKWKYDKSLSSTDKLSRNDKNYFWCTGPGHGGVSMWTIHESGTCQKKSDDSGGTNNNNSAISRQSLTAALQGQGLSGDEVTSKIQAIMAVIDS